MRSIALLLFATTVSCILAEDAADFQQKGIAALKESQSNPKLIVEAVRNFAKAAELFEKSGDTDHAVEMNSYLYWCKKKMTLQDIEAFVKGGETTVVASLKAVEEKRVEVSEAQKWFERAEKFAKARSDEHLLIAVRFFEIADRFKGIDLDTSTAAMDRSLKEMQAFSVVASKPAIANKSTTPGLLVHYTFDEEAGTIARDSSGNGIDGTFIKNPAWAKGVLGSALRFDGKNDAVNAPNFRIDGNSPVTVVFWTRVSKSEIQDGPLFSVGPGLPNRLAAHVPWTDNNLYWDYGEHKQGRLGADYGPYLEKWTHVALVSAGNGGTFKAIYLNGKLAASSEVSGGPSIPISGLRIAQGDTHNADRHYAGMIDDFRIYNRVLNKQEIEALAAGAQSPRVIPASPLNSSAPLAGGKPAVPDAAKLKEAEKLIKEINKDDYAKKEPAERVLLANKLIGQAKMAAADPVEKFSLLHEAALLGEGAGESGVVMNALEEMARFFDIDLIARKTESLKRASSAANSPQSTVKAGRSYLDLLADCMTAERFDDAKKVLPLAEAAVQRSQNVALVSRMKSQAREVRELSTQFSKFKSAQTALEAKPDDAIASLSVGKYLCFIKADWGKGLPFLANSSDAAIKTIAAKETASSTDPAALIEIADGWYAISKKDETERGRSNLRIHATEFYERALAALPEGLQRIKVEKQLDEIAAASFGDAALPKLSEKERGLLLAERTELLQKAKNETDKLRQAPFQIKAAQNALKAGNIHTGLSELDRVVKNCGKSDYGNPSAQALLAKGKFFASIDNWEEAEKWFSLVWKTYVGSYGDHGCEAALIMAKYYEQSKDMEKAMQLREIIIGCVGTNGDAAAASCHWFADYYLKQGDKIRATFYLKKVVETHPGAYGNAKKAAEAKLEKLKK